MLRMFLLSVSVALSSTVTPPVVVREEQMVRVQGEPEVWRLVWRGRPGDRNDCGPAAPDTAMTCPCSGVAYAQTGDLVLERRRAGARTERLALTPLFAGSEMPLPAGRDFAMLPRWPVDPHDADRTRSADAIRDRPAVPIMKLHDYDHDGIAGEFLLQVSVAPCGKRVDVAVGVTRTYPRLHVLTTAEHPERPLMLFQSEWEALARKSHPGEVVDWLCGDHGAEEETSMLLRAENGRLHATRITSSCANEEGAKGAVGAGWSKTLWRKRVLAREIM